MVWPKNRPTWNAVLGIPFGPDQTTFSVKNDTAQYFFLFPKYSCNHHRYRSAPLPSSPLR